MTQEDLDDFDPSYNHSINRSKTRLDIKRELPLSNDNKNSETSTTNKFNVPRNIKSAPYTSRSKSQLIEATKRKEITRIPYRPALIVIPLKNKYMCTYVYIDNAYFLLSPCSNIVFLFYDIVSSVIFYHESIEEQ